MSASSLHPFLSAAVAAGMLVGAAAASQAAEVSPLPEATISVAGEGESSIAPDLAIIELGVLREAATAAEALAASSSAMTDVLAALDKEGIAAKDMQTSGFSIQPHYEQAERKNGAYQSPKIVGYQVRNGVTIRVRDLARLGAVIDRTVKLGVNEGGNIRFTNENPEAALEEARRQAVAQAIAKARTLAEAAGVKLGRVLSINENSMRPMPVPMMRMAAAKEMSDSMPVAAGENAYSVTVNLSYAIAQ